MNTSQWKHKVDAINAHNNFFSIKTKDLLPIRKNTNTECHN